MHLIIWVVCLFGVACANQKTVPVFQLLDGRKMPVVGLGTFLMTSEEVDKAVTSALEIGYRHIDASPGYKNEKDIGNTLKKWLAKGNKREDLYISTKLSMTDMRASDVKKAVQLSLDDLGLDYLDLYLIHAPFGLNSDAYFNVKQDSNGNNIFEFPAYANCSDKSAILDLTTDHLAIWKELEKLVKVGKIKSIGVSNFNKTQLIRLWKAAEIKPSNLQVEVNPYLQQEGLRVLCKQLGIVMTAYSPLGSGGIIHMRRKREAIELPALLKHPVVVSIAEAHKKSPAQVLLRYGFQRRLVVIPKSTNPERLKENIDIFNFAITTKEMKTLKTLDQHGKFRKFDFLSIPGVEHHPEYPFTDRIPKEN